MGISIARRILSLLRPSTVPTSFLPKVDLEQVASRVLAKRVLRLEVRLADAREQVARLLAAGQALSEYADRTAGSPPEPAAPWCIVPGAGLGGDPTSFPSMYPHAFVPTENRTCGSILGRGMPWPGVPGGYYEAEHTRFLCSPRCTHTEATDPLHPQKVLDWSRAFVNAAGLRPESFLIWWLTQGEVEAVENAPLPDQIKTKLDSLRGRAGHGRLWTSPGQPRSIDVLWPDATTPLGKHLVRCGGVVISIVDAPHLERLPGLLTTFRLERWPRANSTATEPV